MTSKKANNAILWISDKLWQSLNADEEEVGAGGGTRRHHAGPKKAFELEKAAPAA